VPGVILLYGCSSDADLNRPDPSKELTLNDVSYGADSLNTMDIFLPKNRTSQTSVIVFVHGGGWTGGSKEEFTSLANTFAGKGYVSITMNYRYADVQRKISYADLLTDIDQALAFLKTKSNEYTFNSNRITLFGHSAGAHLSLLYAYRNNERHQVRSVVSLAGPTDLPDLLEAGAFPSLLYNLVGSEELKKYEDASPIDHVNAGAVPTYCFHGKADTSVPYQQSEKLYEALKNKNSSARIKLFDDTGHEFSVESYNVIVTETLGFIE
jgi:acetyl esterase/lipase